MARFELSQDAVTDLGSIADYTIETFGIEQARRYRDEFQGAFVLLADNPRMGRSYEHIKAGYRRHDHASHAIFYSIEADGILLFRIPRISQDPVHHLPSGD